MEGGAEEVSASSSSTVERDLFENGDKAFWKMEILRDAAAVLGSSMPFFKRPFPGDTSACTLFTP